VAKRLLDVFYDEASLAMPMKQFTDKKLLSIAHVLQNFSVKPNATEGYRTAEVTLGGVDCNEISSKSFEAIKVPGLFFIGEVLDVSGWLGGYNFQWAWSSGWAAGQIV
jgi:predicted flavoprotein YhiN